MMAVFRIPDLVFNFINLTSVLCSHIYLNVNSITAKAKVKVADLCFHDDNHKSSSIWKIYSTLTQNGLPAMCSSPHLIISI